MKQVIQWITRMVFLVVLSVSVVHAQNEQRVALVIGNGAYQDAPLRNPPNDARAMAQALRQCDFEVIERINSDQRTMEEAIRSFGQKIQSGGVGLFYYAGHGMQVQGTNYLIPVGAEMKAEDEVKYKAIDAGMVLSKMEAAGNRMNIVILDACRNNPFARSFRSVDRGLKKMDAPKGTLLAYATAPGDVAADGEGANGLYTAMLLKHLDTPGLAVEQMFKRVRSDVMQATGDSQVPWESTSLSGDFFFAPGIVGAQMAVPGLPVTQRDTIGTASGERYVGEYKDGLPNGQGKLYDLNGIITYEGQFKDNDINGQGIYYFPNGGRYVGEFKDETKHGQGILYDPNGTIIYIGEFKDDKRHGQGTLYWSNSRYVGEFKDDKRHGQGILYWSDGRKYVGEYKDGKFDGQGTFYYPDGTIVYKGQFKDDKMHGQGVLYNPDGTIIYEGQFKNGEYVGK